MSGQSGHVSAGIGGIGAIGAGDPEPERRHRRSGSTSTLPVFEDPAPLVPAAQRRAESQQMQLLTARDVSHAKLPPAVATRSSMVMQYGQRHAVSVSLPPSALIGSGSDPLSRRPTSETPRTLKFPPLQARSPSPSQSGRKAEGRMFAPAPMDQWASRSLPSMEQSGVQMSDLPTTHFASPKRHRKSLVMRKSVSTGSLLRYGMRANKGTEDGSQRLPHSPFKEGGRDVRPLPKTTTSPISVLSGPADTSESLG